MRRIAAAATVAFLSAGSIGACAGWEATAEARMACCLDDDACPMHTAADGAARGVTQADADSCCAASDRDDSTPSTSAYVAVVSLELAVSPVAAVAEPAGTPADAWRASRPLPGRQVPKHVLLSIFLI